MSASHQFLTLVTGATGAQGGATARALLTRGFRVRVLTRNPNTDGARSLAQQGAELAKGDMSDAASLEAAMAGIQGVFSVQLPDTTGADSERQHAFALIAAARKAGVSQFVHTSVAQTGRHTRFPRWGTGYWMEKYWTDKWDIEEAVRAAGFRHWTVLKPAFMMENYLPPKVRFMFPQLRVGRILTALQPNTRLQHIAAVDIGAFACAAFDKPERFHQQNIDLAAEDLTMNDVASIIARTIGKQVMAQSVSPADAIAAGLYPGWVRSQEWSNEVSYGADIARLSHWGVTLTSFETWARQHATEFVVNS